ncbi:MAG: type II secretion system F family protein [Anaerolineae bacterium]|jgi:tight adherence protein C|nr:MAG: type II secretion system F family protein [Anaerolineae bacterium]MCL4879935.1 type II secretion system F family protein [Anaerolineae bacterium]
MGLLGPLILLVIGIILLGGLIIVGRRGQSDVDPLEQRLAQYGDRELPASLEELEMTLSFQDRVIVPMYQGLAKLVVKFTPENRIEEIRTKLDRAGMLDKQDPTTFFGQQIALMIGLGAGAFFLFFFMTDWPTMRATIGTFAGAALGYYLPMLQLSSKISKRKDTIVKSLPDALDLMVICVEAGLGFDAAMGKVYEKWDNDLALAFGRIIQEIQLGKARREAMRDMSNRLDVTDFTTFAAAIIQADQLGVSIGKILRIQSDQMRVKRRQRAQEKAQQAPVKMMIPMTFFIFPAIWIVLLGPSVMVVMEAGVF